MKNRKFILLFALLLTLGIVLAACGGGSDDTDDNGETDDNAASEGEESGYTVAMVTDEGGVDDKSFNQSAWEGLQAWGEEHDLSKADGFDYAQSDDESDYLPNMTRLVRNDYDLVFGIGFLLEDAITQIAEQNPDKDFAIVDTVVDVPNVASITFAEHEGSFLAGVAAAMKSKTERLGFVGGVDSDLINKFESGFIAGAKSVNPAIVVDTQYVGNFSSAADGKLIATRMYNDGADIIYHAAGAAGNGVFAQAKDIKQNDPDREVWVVGVDRDQHDEGQIGDNNVTLTSMVKRVDTSVQEVSNMGLNGEFPGGEIVEFGLTDDGVSIATTNEDALTEEILSTVNDWKERIINGDIDVPKTHEELDAFVDSL
ncbi:BMP family ABC transporter substrate-binding protein [Virgibacillus sp. C22-A2]|uniref:BMP family ABC transporter substrate-binding protein n=1 Tax=Virgibacillus tibetensis TaxID=3042313 RepID=A0ABU6KBW3_9BACI|nr:BMP family ABC transporter substrate-binding protein [Virgibacillus sp. C22-A2]